MHKAAVAFWRQNMESSRSLRSLVGTLLPKTVFLLTLPLLPNILVAQDSSELNSLLEHIPNGAPFDALKVTRAFDSRVSRDPQKALRLLLKAANLGHPGAQTSLGYLYALGQVVPKDEE